jgi:hypothetical protein
LGILVDFSCGVRLKVKGNYDWKLANLFLLKLIILSFLLFVEQEHSTLKLKFEIYQFQSLNMSSFSNLIDKARSGLVKVVATGHYDKGQRLPEPVVRVARTHKLVIFSYIFGSPFPSIFQPHLSHVKLIVSFP